MIEMIVGSVCMGVSLAIALLVCIVLLYAVQWLVENAGGQAVRLKIWLKQKRRKKRHENSQSRH